MAKVYKSMLEIQKAMESAIAIAVERASNILLERLQEFIQTDYYDMYEPIYYSRSYDFMSSAVREILSPTHAHIGMDDTKMSYGDYWDGETQLYMADAGFHGNVSIYREGFFFKDFVAWCDENAISILRLELAKQGIKTK